MSTRVEQNKYDHKQIDVEYNDAIITVDEGIVELLTMIWKEGYETFNSCQNNFGNIWIEFDMYSFHELVQKARDYETDQMTSAHLYDFLQCECDNSVCLNDDGHPDEDDIYWVPGENMYLSCSVRFPMNLLDEFMKLFREAHAVNE